MLLILGVLYLIKEHGLEGARIYMEDMLENISSSLEVSVSTMLYISFGLFVPSFILNRRYAIKLGKWIFLSEGISVLTFLPVFLSTNISAIILSSVLDGVARVLQ